MIDWNELIEGATQNQPPARDTALACLELPDTETLRLVDAAWRARRTFFADRTRVNVLLNTKSGYCPEDCGYCSQSSKVQTPINRYPMQSTEQIVAAARAANEAGAQRFCIVSALRGPSWSDIKRVADAARQIRSEMGLELCASLGLLDDPEKAKALAEAGIDAYNHNLNTSEERYGDIATTHTYQDRLDTVRMARAAGLSPCSGVILGMGETNEEIVDLAFALRAEGAESIPVNFLLPIDDTPLGDGVTAADLTPWSCLRALSVFRLVNPAAEIRASAGREVHLRSLQPLAMLVANSLFLGDYLTEEGQSPDADWAMLADLGLQPETVREVASA